MATRSEFARHFGPAALRREALRRYGVEAEPRRVAPGSAVWLALSDTGGPPGADAGSPPVAAWAAVVEGPAGPHDPTPPVEAVCAVWRRPGRRAVVAWGAVCATLGSSMIIGNGPVTYNTFAAAGWHGRPRAAPPFVVGRATGPAVWAPGIGVAGGSRAAGCRSPCARWTSCHVLYTTNDTPACGECESCRARAAKPRPRVEARRPFERATCEAGARVPLQFDAAADSLGVPCRAGFVRRVDSTIVEAAGLRWRRRPPTRLAAGRALYRDAPTRAAAVAALGRRGEKAAAYVCR